MNPMKAYETAKSLSADQLMSAMKGGIPEIPAYIAASVMQEQKKTRDAAVAQKPVDKRTVMQELEEEALPTEPQPTGIAALPQMSQGGEEVPDGGIAGYAEGGQVSTGYPTQEIKELSKNDEAEKRMSDYYEYKANGGTEPFEVWMKNAAVKGYAFGGQVEEDDAVGDMDELEREYAEYAAAQGYANPVAASAKYTAAPATAAAPTTTEGKMPFSDAITHTESRGRDFDSKGNPLKSSAGALYARQVMPKTAANPGYGIKPAVDQSPEEYNRIGVEYEGALLKKYDGNQAKVAAAYNAGPGTVDKAVRAARAAGEPDAWREYMRNHQSKKNFEQTYGYVDKVAGLAGIRPFAAGGIVKGYSGEDGESLVDPRNPTEEQLRKKYNLKPGEISLNPGVWIDSARSKNMQTTPWSSDEPNVAGDVPFSVLNNQTVPDQDLSSFSGDRAGYTPVAKPAAAQVQTTPDAKPAAKDVPTTSGIPAAGAAAGITMPAFGDKNYDRYMKILDRDIPKLDPKYEARIAKEQDRLDKDRSGNFDRTLIDIGLGIMSGTSPHALVNAGTGATAGLKNMDARLAGYDKRGDMLEQRDLMLAQAAQARAQGNVMGALKLEQGADKLSAFAMKAVQGHQSPEMQAFAAWKADNPNGTYAEFAEEISGVKNAPKMEAKLRENYLKDKTAGLIAPNETYQMYVMKKDPQFAERMGYGTAQSSGKITTDANGITVVR